MLSFDDYLQDKLKDEKFVVGYEEAKAEVSFGHSLAQMRERLDLTQSQLAERSGIKQPMIAHIEHGQMPKPATLQKLAKALKAKIIFTGEKILVESLKVQRKSNAVDASGLVNAVYKTRFQDRVESEVPINKITDLNEYKKRRQPITSGKIEKYEEKYESVKSIAR